MKTESAVDFPGKRRLHLALTVSDLERSTRFYELLLGVQPSKQRPRYAKFEPADPSVNLTLNEAQAEAQLAAGPSHFGVQVKSVAEVHAAIERFQAAGLETATEESTTCCYALQDKVWVSDPDGHRWEVFVVLDADVQDELYAQEGCCGPDLVSLSPCGSPPEDG